MKIEENIISLKQVADFLKRRKEIGDHPYILFLGTGVSMASGIPRMHELINKFLIEDVAIPQKDLERLNDFQKINLFSEVMENRTDDDRFDWLYLLFKDAVPSDGYEALMDLMREGFFDIILSNNFDFMLEEAIRNNQKIKESDFLVLIRGRESQEYIIENLQRMKPRIKIVKLHGDLMSRKFYFTPGETLEFPHSLSDELTRLFLNRDLLMIGVSDVDMDFLKCLTKNRRSLIYVNPYRPGIRDFLYLANFYKSVKIVKGQEARFDFFFNNIKNLLEATKKEITLIGRDREIRNIELSLNQLLQKKVEKSIIEINGIGGIGKTIILKNIANICQTINLPFAVYDFEFVSNLEIQDIRSPIEEIINQIIIKTKSKEELKNIFERPLLKGEDIQKLFINYLIEIFREENKPIVLIFDTLDKINDDIQKWLAYLISETTRVGRIIFVLASKSALNLSIDERIRQKWQIYKISQFSFDQTKDQIQFFERGLSPEDMEELCQSIFNITKGHPLANELICKKLIEKNITTKNFQDYTQYFIQLINKELIDRVIFKKYKLEDHKKLRSILEILSIARIFNSISLQILIDTFAKQEYRLSSSFKYSKYIIEEQIKNNLIHYDQSKKGYAVDHTLAIIFSSIMKKNKPNLYKKINQKLIDIYNEWISYYSGSDKINYIKEKYYHKLKIDIPINLAIDEFKKDLEMFRGRKNEHLRLQFKDELKGDIDLYKLLGNRITELIDYIESLK